MQTQLNRKYVLALIVAAVKNNPVVHFELYIDSVSKKYSDWFKSIQLGCTVFSGD